MDKSQVRAALTRRLAVPLAVILAVPMLSSQAIAFAGSPSANSAQSNVSQTSSASAVSATNCAAIITVTSIADSGVGSLRQALNAVCASGTVSFDPSLTTSGLTTITLSSGTLAVTQNVTLAGPGQFLLAVSGNNRFTVFSILNGVTASISGMTIRDGNAYNGNGGGILNAGALTVSSSSIFGNAAVFGGGVFNTTGSRLTLLNDTVALNVASAAGGGVYSSGNPTTILNSTVSNNTGADIGGIANKFGQLIVSNSTVANNVGSTTGGIVTNQGLFTATQTTITNNSGGAVYQYGGTAYYYNTIIAGNTPGTDCIVAGGGMIGAIDRTLIQDGTCNAPLSGDPKLGILQNNGGSTWTNPLLPGSPAIDTANAAYCPTTDERGISRPQGPACDIGAFEVANYFTITPSAGANGGLWPNTPQYVLNGGSVVFGITPNSGYYISNVTVDGNSVGAVSQYTFNNVTGNHTINAQFSNSTFTISPAAYANGSIWPNTNQTVNYGGSTGFTIAPNAGYSISNVYIDGAPVGGVSQYTFNNVTGNHTIVAVFSSIATFTLSPSAGANGAISPNTNQTVNYGGSQTFSITPNTGYTISDVRVDGNSVGAVSSYTFSNVTSNHTITASFALSPSTYVLTPYTGAYGSITPNTPQTVNAGGSQAFSISPYTGFHIADVGVDGVSVGAVSTYSFTNVTANHTITASFAVNLNSYILTPSSGPNGSITPHTPQGVVSGGSLRFNITPDTGYTISDVGIDGASVGAVSTYSFTNVTANHAITASFAISVVNYVLSPIASANGSFDLGTPQKVKAGATKVFTIKPNTGYAIQDVRVDGVSVGAVNAYTFAKVNANHVITATFASAIAITVVVTPTIAPHIIIIKTVAKEIVGTPVPMPTIAPHIITPVPMPTVAPPSIVTPTVAPVATVVPVVTVATDTPLDIVGKVSTYTFVVTPLAGPNGSISPNKPQTVNKGANQEFTIKPDAGYTIQDVLVDGISVGAVKTYTFENVTANHTIAVTFIINKSQPKPAPAPVDKSLPIDFTGVVTKTR